MFNSIYLKTIFNLRWQLFGWVLLVIFVSLLTMALFNSFNQAGIDSIVNSVPDSLKSLIGSVDDFKTISGFIGQQIFGPNLVILTIAMSVLFFVSISANEEDDGRLETLLSFPVTRSAVFWQKWLAVATVIALVCASIVVGVAIGLAIINESADMSRIIQSTAACFLMNLAYGTVAFAAATFTGKKGLTIAIASGYAAVSFIISSLAPAVDALKTVDMFSIFHYYNNPQIMQHGIDASHIWILVGITVGLLAVGWARFVRRDIGV
jgi:ABC-2 type transport system permease protein